MDDTDQLLRVTTPFVRPQPDTLEPLAYESLDDRTPTTAPGETPGTPRRRLARGTMSPPIDTLRLPAPALPVRTIDPPARWGYRVQVDLATTVIELTSMSGEVTAAADTTQRLPRALPGRWLVAAAAAIAALALVGAVAVIAGQDDARGSSPTTAAVPALVVTPLPSAGDEAAGDEAVAAPRDAAILDTAAVDEAILDTAAVDEAILELEPAPAPPASTSPAPASPAPAPRPAPAVAAAPAHGTLMIGSKPPCRIYIDGQDTGLVTPHRDLRVPAGRRTISLVNDEHGIHHTTTVVVPGGRSVKVIRDLLAPDPAR